MFCVAGLAVVALTYFGMVYGLMRMSIAPMRRTMDSTPAEYGHAYEDIEFRSRDGVTLKGWLIPGSAKSQHATIVFCHGIDADRRAMLESAKILHEAGYACLLFDFRARGESGGNVCTLGWRETDDLLAAVNWVRSRRELHSQPIGVLGVSMGAATAIRASARTKEIAAIVVEAPFSRLEHAVALRFSRLLGPFGALFARPVQWAGERKLGFSADQIAPVVDVARLSPRPLLLIADGADSLFPHTETDAIFDAAREPKQRWIVPGAPHAGARYVAHEEYVKRVTKFFGAALK